MLAIKGQKDIKGACKLSVIDNKKVTHNYTYEKEIYKYTRDENAKTKNSTNNYIGRRLMRSPY